MQKRIHQLEMGWHRACICAGEKNGQKICGQETKRGQVCQRDQMPGLLYNDRETGRSVLEAMEEELLHCEEFQISVAFITEGGMRLLKPVFEELEKRMVRGRILTTDYQNISEPQALLELDQFKNIELRIFGARENKTGFHTKGYLFRREGLYRIIIGSSNMTAPALTKNKEWNIRFISTEQGEILQSIRKEYEKMWDSSMSLQEWLDHYPTKN